MVDVDFSPRPAIDGTPSSKVGLMPLRAGYTRDPATLDTQGWPWYCAKSIEHRSSGVGMRRRPQITIDVVAAEAGVSASTVSHVLNGRADTARISRSTSERVRDAARRLGYTPNHAARSLRRQRTGIITVLAWRLSSPFFADIATGVRNVAQRHGFQVSVIDAGALDRDVEIRALASLRTGICDGVVVATGTHSRRGPPRTPCWSLRRAAPRSRWCWTAARIQPCRRSTWITWAARIWPRSTCSGSGTGGSPTSRSRILPSSGRAGSPAARYLGYRQAFAEIGLEPDPACLFRGGREIEGGRTMAHELLGRFPDPLNAPPPSPPSTIARRSA